MARHPLVLIVDYDPKNLKALTDLFCAHGYSVESVSDGMAAITAFKKNHPDIVLLEAMIPKKHGFEVCQEIKKLPEGKSTPVIIMTAVYKGRKYRSQAMHVHGCDEYVEKPCPPETILEIVTRFVPAPARALQGAGSSRSQRSFESSPGPDGERLGEVIPFPMGRSGRATVEYDDETEREIMSRLDEILPDTPLFESPSVYEPAPIAASAAAPAVDLSVEPEPIASPVTIEDTIEIDTATYADADVEAGSGPSSPARVPLDAAAVPSSKPADASAPQPEKDAQRSQRRTPSLEIIPPPKPKSNVLPVLLVSLGLSIAALVLYLLSLE